MIQRRIGGMKLLLVDDLGPEDLAMVQALYARSTESAEVHIQRIYDGRRADLLHVLVENQCITEIDREDLLEDIYDAAYNGTGSAKAGAFMSSYYVGYGHKSIADCGSTTLFIEGVSLLAAKAIQDWPLYSGQETSTRAIDFSGATKDRLVGELIDPIGTPESAALQGRWMAFYLRSQERLARDIERRYPIQEGENPAVYMRAVHARVFDILRGFLPAGVTTQLSWHTNLRQAGDHLSGLQHHPLEEVRRIAEQLLSMLRTQYPSSGGSLGEAAALSGVGPKNEDTAAREVRQSWEAATYERYAYPAQHWPDPFHSSVKSSVLTQHAALIATRPRGCVLPHFLADAGQLTFGFNLDFGSFRDIQRHRHGVCRMPVLTTECGFERWYLEQLDIESYHEATVLLDTQVEALRVLHNHPTSALVKQYYTAIGFKVPTRVTYNLPAAVYVMELRSGTTVHPTLRKAVQAKMIAPFQNMYPEVRLHVNMDPDSWTLRRGAQIIERR